jgi:tetratricopeptide (TPR) repeat protein
MSASQLGAAALLGLVMLSLGADGESATDALSRGDSLVQKGELDAALAAYTEAIRLDPKDAAAHYERGKVYEQKGEKAKAEEDLDRAKKLGHVPPPEPKEPSSPEAGPEP